MNKSEILGELKLNNTGCTNSIKMHPIHSGTWCLCPIGMAERNHHYASLISFDKRQMWDVYYSGVENFGVWIVERNGLYLRMPEKDFERFFWCYF